MSIKPVIFLHVPKTGGTTINYILNHLYKTKFIWLRNDIIEEDSNFIAPIDIFFRINEVKRTSFTAVAGHQIRPLIDHLPNNFNRALLVRDPIKQIPSYYAHHRRKRSNTPSNIEVVSYPTLKDFVQSDSIYYPNPQVKNIFNDCIESIYDPEVAKEKIKDLVWNKIDLCGTTENFEGFLSLLSTKLNWKNFSYTVMNQRPEDKVGESSEIDKLIKERNKLDFFLHEQASQKLEQVLQESPLKRNFKRRKSPYFLDKLINKIQQHRIAQLAGLKLKEDAHLKSKLFNARNLNK